MTPALTTSFIIPHKGRLELLHQTVASIHAQTRYDWIESIVVVTMNTDPICFENDDKVIVLTIPDAPSISYQRNQGAAKSSASYLAFLDADIELAPEWLETCHRLLAERPVRHMVSAMQRCKHDDNPIERVRSALSNAALDVNVSFLPGRNLLLSRDDFFEAGAFPEHLKTCEDYYFTERVSARGELFYTSKTWYYHLGEDASYWETFSKERWRSEYNLLSVRGRSVPVAEWPSLLLPFWFVLSAVLGIIGLLIANEDITNIALLAAIAPLIVYSIRLYAKNTGTLRLWDIVKFYAAYFPGRALGTTIGIKKAISSIKDSKIQQIRCTQQSKNECKKSGTPLKRPLRVMEFICPTGYYGAERWVIALAKNMDRTHVLCELVVTHECAEPLEVSKQFEALGLPCHAIPLRNRFDLSAIYTLSQLLKKRQIDVLHTHGYKSDILGVIAAKYAGIPAVCTPHGFENAEDWKLRAYLWLGGLSFRFFNVLSPLSPQISHDLTKTYR
ncbi:MAG: glycosyltransferase, partial [Gammaproteobacteria bacterium]